MKLNKQQKEAIRQGIIIEGKHQIRLDKVLSKFVKDRDCYIYYFDNMEIVYWNDKFQLRNQVISLKTVESLLKDIDSESK